MDKFPFFRPHRPFRAAATVAVLASATEAEDGNAPPWRPDDEYASQVRSSMGPGSDGPRFAHLQFIIQTDIGQEEFGRGMTAFWWRITHEPDAFPPEFFQLFLVNRASPRWEKLSVGLSGH